MPPQRKGGAAIPLVQPCLAAADCQAVSPGAAPATSGTRDKLRMQLGKDEFLLCSGQDVDKGDLRGQQTNNEVRLH